MFRHLVEENKLDTELSVYLKEDLKINKKFITELIKMLTKDETQVHKIVLYNLRLIAIMDILIRFVNGR